MFKSVKSKLTYLFTCSLLTILIMFILSLYLLITNEIRKNEVDEINKYYEMEQHEWIEELFKHKHGHIEYEPERNMFYYLFDKRGKLVDAEENINGFSSFIENKKLYLKTEDFITELEWKKSHLLLARYNLEYEDNVVGTVILGMEITNEKHLIKNIIWILVVLTILFSGIFAVAGYFFAGQAIKPIQKSYLTQRKFVSDASHELRTPLSIFYSSIDLLDKEEKKNMSSFGQDVLEDVKNEAELMNELLNDLLFLARSDQDHIELEIHEVNLSKLFFDLLKRFTRILPPTITLISEIEEEVFIKGDATRLQQLLYILLDNASNYTQDGSIRCILQHDERDIHIKIIDTGSGIDKKDLPLIFDRFYRSDPSRNRKGTGLGLSIAKTIVDAHSGEIHVDSEINKGTEFHIIFKVQNQKRL